jgi:hypothetical protein
VTEVVQILFNQVEPLSLVFGAQARRRFIGKSGVVLDVSRGRDDSRLRRKVGAGKLSHRLQHSVSHLAAALVSHLRRVRSQLVHRVRDVRAVEIVDYGAGGLQLPAASKYAELGEDLPEAGRQ